MTRDAIVIGAGIGGLACATALAQRGVQVTLLERSAELREVGAGLQVSPNGLAVLRRLGLEVALDHAGAVQARAVVLADYQEGRQVARLDLTRLAPQRYLFVHRADLVAVLANAARAAGVAIELGKEAVQIYPGPTPRAAFSDGSERRAGLVICADGLHSIGRPTLNGPDQPFFTGQVAWRATVPTREAVPEARVTMGPGRHMVNYPLRDGERMNLVAVEERRDWAEEGWNHLDDPDNLRRAFADYGGQAASLLEQVEEVHLWGLFRHPVAACWHRDGVALLGDAAHPTLPFLAQGANMALEDAWVLADCAVRGGMKEYQPLRHDRVDRIIRVSNGNAKRYHLRPGPVRSLAHMALTMGSRFAPGVMLHQFDWLYGHDVTAA